MTVYIVSYELKGETGSSGYQPLWDALEGITSQKVQRSLWLVATTGSASDLHSYLKQYMDDNDRLWVSKVTQENHYYGAMAGTTKFLADYL
jgi:hypothetical protein